MLNKILKDSIAIGLMFIKKYWNKIKNKYFFSPAKMESIWILQIRYRLLINQRGKKNQ